MKVARSVAQPRIRPAGRCSSHALAKSAKYSCRSRMSTSSLVLPAPPPPARQASRKSSGHTNGLVSPSYLLMFVGRWNHWGICVVRMSWEKACGPKPYASGLGLRSSYRPSRRGWHRLASRVPRTSLLGPSRLDRHGVARGCRILPRRVPSWPIGLPPGAGGTVGLGLPMPLGVTFCLLYCRSFQQGLQPLVDLPLFRCRRLGKLLCE